MSNLERFEREREREREGGRERERCKRADATFPRVDSPRKKVNIALTCHAIIRIDSFVLNTRRF